VIHLQAAGTKRTVAIAAIVLAAMVLSWLSWQAGSPLLTEFRANASNVKSQGLRLWAPKGAPKQRVGLP
jgi:hypothetical protein